MRCLIVDDDPVICDLLNHYCSKDDRLTEILICHSGFEAIKIAKENDVDLAFLDFHLPDITAKDLIEVLPAELPVIMITSNKDFALKAFNYDNVLDYIDKPISYARFIKALDRFFKRNKATSGDSLIFIKDGNALIKINTRDILFIRGAGNYAELIFENKKHMSLMTLKMLEEKLPPTFQRIHRSCIVNIDKIDQIKSGDVVIGQHELAVSKKYEAGLMSKINLLF